MRVWAATRLLSRRTGSRKTIDVLGATMDSYLLGGHRIDINFEAGVKGVSSLGPFEIMPSVASGQQPIMRVAVDIAQPYSAEESTMKHGSLRHQAGDAGWFDVFDDSRTGGVFLYFYASPSISSEVTASIKINRDFSDFRISLSPLPSFAMPAQTLMNALMVCYSFAASRQSTLILHSSTIVYRGWAYMFLGGSGVGKSTHSQLWLRGFDECELLNDDNPIVRLDGSGLRAYGSPWSGKTPCYKQLSAPVGAIVELCQSGENEIVSLCGVEAYASILSNCNTLRCNSRAYNAILDTAAKLVERVPIYRLKNRPDAEAAELCRDAICRHSKQ